MTTGAHREGGTTFQNLRVTAEVATDATSEHFETLRTETERRCPVSQLFVLAGVEVTSTWTQLQTASA